MLYGLYVDKEKTQICRVVVERYEGRELKL